MLQRHSFESRDLFLIAAERPGFFVPLVPFCSNLRELTSVALHLFVSMSSPSASRHFVQLNDAIRELAPWTSNEWLCRPDLVPAEKLLLVRPNMAPMHSHPFHYHAHREEIIYVLYGRAEQWVDREHRILLPGEIAHIPAGVVHGTYNPYPEPLVFLAMLSPAKLSPDLAAVPDPCDVSDEAPWASIRNGMPVCRSVYQP
jgi:quercetin dioxygenase-like cupin family protein